MVQTNLKQQQPQRRRVQRPSGTQDLTVGSAPKFSLLTVRDIRNVQSISSHAYIKSETASRGGFSLYKDASNRSVFSVDMIQVRGNWKINATSIYTGTEDFSGYTTNAGDITIYSDGSNASIHAKNFYINTAGNLTATGVTLTGAITATSGGIGGWTINSTSIYTGTEDHAGYTGSAGDMTLYAAGGNASIHATNWYIDTSGNMEVKGGHIANWTIVQGALFTGADDHSGYTANAGDFTIFSDGSNASIHANKWYIDINGQLFCNTGNFAGEITSSATITGGAFRTAADGTRVDISTGTIVLGNGINFVSITQHVSSGATLVCSGNINCSVLSGTFVNASSTVTATTGFVDGDGGAGVDGTFTDHSSNTVTVSGGIITSLS